MLKSAVFEEHLTTEKIVEIAKNILEHSETDIELGSLCAEINRAAYTFFIEEEKEIAKEIDTYKAEYFLINDNCIFNRRIIIFGSLYDKYLYYSQILKE